MDHINIYIAVLRGGGLKVNMQLLICVKVADYCTCKSHNSCVCVYVYFKLGESGVLKQVKCAVGGAPKTGDHLEESLTSAVKYLAMQASLIKGRPASFSRAAL